MSLIPSAPLIRSLPLSQPFGLPVYLAQFPLAGFIEWQLRTLLSHFGFDELRRSANLAPRMTFNIIYPAAPAQSRVHFLRPAAVVRDDDPPKAIKGEFYRSLNSRWRSRVWITFSGS